MLSTFLSKSKPINFIAISLYLIVIVLIVSNKQALEVLNSNFFYLVLGLIFYLVSMALLYVIARRSNLTSKGTVVLFLYVSLCCMVPEALAHVDKIIASSFVLLSFSQITEMMNHTKAKAKIFNASLCIGLASTAYFWSIGFIALIFIGIYFFRSTDYRNWFVPIIGVITVFVLANCFTLLVFDSFFNPVEKAVVSYEAFANTLYGAHFFTLGALSICAGFFLIAYTLRINSRPTSYKPLMKLIIGYIAIGIGVVLVSPNKDTSEMIFIIPPLAIMGATYIELIQIKFIKEIHLWVFGLLPLLFLLF
ncbi:DUF6427 family protein [Aquimarina intermedia]|nr:DUF6427 family protein [Aquimarina intermedia]